MIRIFKDNWDPTLNLVKIREVVFALLIGLILTMSVDYNASANSIFEDVLVSLSEDLIQVVLVSIFVFFLLDFCRSLRKYTEKNEIYKIILSLIYAGMWMAGSLFGTSTYLNLGRLIRLALVLVITYIIMYKIITIIFILLQSFRHGSPKYSSSSQRTFIIFVILILLWTPYLICLYPGITAPNDTLDEIRQTFSIRTATSEMANVPDGFYLNNHHPFLYTALLGIFTRIGLLFGTANIGLGLLATLQLILLAASSAYMLGVSMRLGLWKSAISLSVLFLGIMPIFPLSAVLLSKDVVFTSVFIMTNSKIADLVINKDFCKKKLIVAGFFVTMLCLLRSTAIYVVGLYAVLVILCALHHHQYARLVPALIIPVFLCSFITSVVFGFFNIYPGSKGEMLAVPYNQVARTYIDFPDDFSESDIEVINNVLGETPVQIRYNFVNADGIKNTRNFDVSSKDTFDFILVWLKQGILHPFSYLIAHIDLVSSYYSPNPDVNKFFALTYSFGWLNNSEGSITDTSSDFNELGLNVSQGGLDNRGRFILNSSFDSFRDSVFGYFQSSGFAFSLTLFLCIYSMSFSKDHRIDTVVLFGLPLILYISLAASPANFIMRYYLPLISILPLLIAGAHNLNSVA